jgi:DNA invertase Pin-like site-specific DNA recombinase
MSVNNCSRAVLYGAKSTEDAHGSIPTQLADGRALAERHGWEVVAERQDEAFSAYSGDRGPGLAAAMALCERIAAEDGVAALVVQHSDRLARGDGKTARHLVEIALWALKHDVKIASVQDPQTFGDLLYTVVTGQRNHEDSRRKGLAVKDGMERRRASGKPVGGIPYGYVRRPLMNADGTPVVNRNFTVVNERVVDEHAAAVVVEVFEMFAAGLNPGQVARAFNGRGLRTTRGSGWNRTNTLDMLRHRQYLGEQGYPRIVSDEQWHAAVNQRDRRDPVSIQKRAGGRPTNTDWLLKGIVFCRRCGTPLNTRVCRGKRSYQCRHSRRATGMCDARPIAAELIEGRVLSHLDVFVGDVEAWLTEQVAGRDREHAQHVAQVDVERARLADLSRRRDLLLAEYERLVADADPHARIALEPVGRIDQELDQQAAVVADMQALADEWAGPPDVDAALEFYGRLVDLVRGKISLADGAQALNGALASVLTGVWVEVRDGKLLADFRLAAESLATLLDRLDKQAANPDAKRLILHLGDKPPGQLRWTRRRS